MGQSSSTQSFANSLRRAVARSPESCLVFSGQCLEEVRTMTSPRASKSSEVINYEQCVYLVDSLDKAFHKGSLLLWHIRHHDGNSNSTEDVSESTLEHLKILCMLAKKVKCFIQGCCNGHWLHAAVLLTNLSDCIVSLGFDLKLFTVLLPPYTSRRYSSSPLKIHEVSTLRRVEGELVKEMASKDEDKLVTKLRALIQLGQASEDDLELATFLRERLERFKSSSRPGSLQPILRERDLTNLKDPVRIGRGGFAIVSRAKWLGTDVAVKTFNGTDNPHFKKEVSILASLSHPNIVSFLCHGKDMGKCCIVMELMDQDLLSLMGEKLRRDRTQSSPFSVFEEFDIILQIAEAMDYLHEMRVLHRDLKSENILVRCMKSPNAEGYEYVQVKVSDFGLSRTKEFSLTQSHMTPNTGTGRWMAPELIKFRNTNDIHDTETTEDGEFVENYPFKCDVYSFGMVCLEILTGDVPFPNMEVKEVKRAVSAGERPQLPDRCHEKLKALIEKCWNPNASSRPCFGDICMELRHLKSLHMTPLNREPCLKFSRRCLEEVETMTFRRDFKSSKVINYEQCTYLVHSLDDAVRQASLFLEYNRHHGGSSMSTAEVSESTLEHLKILCMLAKKVKCFIQGCCNGHWLHTAVTLTNLSDCTASLGFDLKLFTVLLPPYTHISDYGYYPLPSSIDEVFTLRHEVCKLVKNLASIDEELVDELRALIRYGQASEDDLKLATFLLERLERLKLWSLPSNIRGSVQPILDERDLTTLKDVVQIARGGFAIVSRASWLGMDLAVKTFNGTDNPHFKKEVSILAGLSHPNIVSFLCQGKDTGECCIVMELMDQDLLSLMGEKLRRDRTQSSPFSVFEEFDIILQIAEAMDYLHEMRVLHRDLKSENILVRCMKSPNAEGYEYVQVKVSDFGLSRTKEFSLTQSHMTPNTGTGRWMAPELIRFRNTNDDLDIETAEDEELVENDPFKCDVYSFGMVCLEILTGAVPFPNLKPTEVQRAVCVGERPRIPDRCHEKLKALIEECWNPEASSRPCFGDICMELRYLKCLHMTPRSLE